MVEKVKGMLTQDPDAQVVANCLQMVCQLEPMSKLAADKAFVYHLINRIKVCCAEYLMSVCVYVCVSRSAAGADVQAGGRVCVFTSSTASRCEGGGVQMTAGLHPAAAAAELAPGGRGPKQQAAAARCVDMTRGCDAA